MARIERCPLQFSKERRWNPTRLEGTFKTGR